mmetsp:Transcript_84690/g.155234  ORF Transcript_84690/g.155234 Transcript_84690/m.155234 type:complete len:209 (-) Transcript_84690:171-797(-)
MAIRRSNTRSQALHSKGKAKARVGLARAVPSRGRLALKVMSQWLSRMKHGSPKEDLKKPKDIEVRSYLPWKFLPPGAPWPRVGSRIYLVEDGKVHGCCTLGRVFVYRNMREFDRDRLRHHVTRKTANSSKVSYEKLKETLASQRVLYGWELRNMHWFKKSSRLGLPQGGKRWQEVRVPHFSGQEYGQVWCSSLLPSALEHRHHLKLMQ